MTDKLDLDELERLEREATKGPWVLKELLRLHRSWGAGDAQTEADEAFIAAIRNAAPRLFERVRELQEIEKMRCEMCSAVAPENEKDWPKTECVVCVLRARISVLESERKSQWDQLQARIAELERQAGEDEAALARIERGAFCGACGFNHPLTARERLASRREGGN